MWLEILVAKLATNFQDLVAKVKNLVALAPVLGTILRPALLATSEQSSSSFIETKLNHNKPNVGFLVHEMGKPE